MSQEQQTGQPGAVDASPGGNSGHATCALRSEASTARDVPAQPVEHNGRLIVNGAAKAEADRRNAAQDGPVPRFFMDHGVWHDSETGKHLFYEGESPEAATVSDAWDALADAGVERDGWLTLAECIAKLAALSKAGSTS